MQTQGLMRLYGNRHCSGQKSHSSARVLGRTWSQINTMKHVQHTKTPKSDPQSRNPLIQDELIMVWNALEPTTRADVADGALAHLSVVRVHWKTCLAHFLSLFAKIQLKRGKSIVTAAMSLCVYVSEPKIVPPPLPQMFPRTKR
eukprot:2800843-Amphidinium_carterae.2